MGPEEYHMQITEEYKNRLTIDEMAKLLANIHIKVENAFYYADLDDLGENLCPLLGLDSAKLEQ